MTKRIATLRVGPHEDETDALKRHAERLGITVEQLTTDFRVVLQRSRQETWRGRRGMSTFATRFGGWTINRPRR